MHRNTTLPDAALPTQAAKAGVNSLTENVALENAPFGVRCNAILPGLVDTPMSIERSVCLPTEV